MGLLKNRARVQIVAPLKGAECMEKEIMSVQVVFPDGRTLDEVMAEKDEVIKELQEKIAAMETAEEAVSG